MLTGRIVRVKRRLNASNSEIPFWTWDSPFCSAHGQFILETNECVLLLEPPMKAHHSSNMPEISWLVLTERGYTYVYLFSGHTIEEMFDEIS